MEVRSGALAVAFLDRRFLCSSSIPRSSRSDFLFIPFSFLFSSSDGLFCTAGATPCGTRIEACTRNLSQFSCEVPFCETYFLPVLLTSRLLFSMPSFPSIFSHERSFKFARRRPSQQPAATPVLLNFRHARSSIFPPSLLLSLFLAAVLAPDLMLGALSVTHTLHFSSFRIFQRFWRRFNRGSFLRVTSRGPRLFLGPCARGGSARTIMCFLPPMTFFGLQRRLKHPFPFHFSFLFLFRFIPWSAGGANVLPPVLRTV